MRKAYAPSKIFTGDQWLEDHVLIVSNGIIEDITSKKGLDSSLTVEQFPGSIIAPGFIDAQVYGAAGKLFSVYSSPETLALMYETFLAEGTVLFVPTIATNTIEVFKKCIDATREYWKQGGKGVPGIHLEGPWINADKRGAHIKEWVRVPALHEVEDLLQYGKGVIKTITIAPEVCSPEVMKLLLEQDIILSAGHSAISYEKAMEGFDKGIHAVTHLFNAMSPLHHREPGLTGASMDHSGVMVSIIPDGHHVAYPVIRLAKKLMKERLFAITDAVTETNEGPYQHHLAGDKYESAGILSGSALSMHKAFINLVNHVGVEVAEALRMCSLYPAKVIGCEDRYGKIAPGYQGQLVVLDKQLALEKVITSK